MTKEKEIERIFERYGFRSLFPEDRPEALGHPDFEHIMQSEHRIDLRHMFNLLHPHHLMQ